MVGNLGIMLDPRMVKYPQVKKRNMGKGKVLVRRRRKVLVDIFFVLSFSIGIVSLINLGFFDSYYKPFMSKVKGFFGGEKNFGDGKSKEEKEKDEVLREEERKAKSEKIEEDSEKKSSNGGFWNFFKSYFQRLVNWLGGRNE